MTEEVTYGPIDYVLIEFPGDSPKGEVAASLFDLIDRGVVRLYDILIVHKDDAGVVSGTNPADVSPDHLAGFGVFAGARSGLLTDDDVQEAGGAMRSGSTAVLIVYENAWAIPFVRAARQAGGELVASARISAQDILDALDTLDATSS